MVGGVGGPTEAGGHSSPVDCVVLLERPGERTQEL